MRIVTKIWDSGWGAIFLTVYTFSATHLLVPDRLLLKPIAFLPTLIVMFLADRYNFQLIHFFAGGELQRSTEQVEQITCDSDFYESASTELQSRINDLDRRAYQNNISILAGTLIGLSAPFIGFHIRDVVGALTGLAVSVVAVQLLARRSIQQLNTLARNITEPYTAKYESQ
jgi:hypothetical protein